MDKQEGNNPSTQPGEQAAAEPAHCNQYHNTRNLHCFTPKIVSS